jgi:hypothetical protein
MKRPFLFLLLFCAAFQAKSQNVPLGQWETHFNYLSAKHLIKVGDVIFCASENGLFSVNIADKQIKIWSKSDGLNDSGISSMAFDQELNVMLLAYKSGNIDLLYMNPVSSADRIVNWPVLMENTDIPDQKDIKRIVFDNKKAYLCTSFGIVVLDVANQQVDETYRYIGTNGAEVSVSDISITTDSLYAVTSQGMLAVSMSPQVNRQDFANWKVSPGPGKAMAVVALGSQIYAGFSGKGLFKRAGGTWKAVFSSASKNYALSASENELVATLDDQIVVLNQKEETKTLTNPLFKTLRDALQTSAGKFWVADLQNGLLHNADTAFQSFTPMQADTTISPKTDSSIIDLNGLSWTRLPEYLGGGIIVKNTEDRQRVLSTNTGSGGLPSMTINSLALGTEGYVWFASDRGVGYFAPDDILGGARADAILPIFGQRKLFANEKCTAIAVEPGNRKWIGTRNGLYLFNEDGTELIEKFLAADSPLPSDSINALQFDAGKGILYIDTPNGMVSYRSASSASSENLSNVTIFPNPVHPGYSGTIGIKGLTDRSTVKIIALSGRLVFETKSQGGIASWNLNDYTGKRVKGGIYMVLIVAQDGSEKFAGKLAVID